MVVEIGPGDVTATGDLWQNPGTSPILGDQPVWDPANPDDTSRVQWEITDGSDGEAVFPATDTSGWPQVTLVIIWEPLVIS